MEATEAAEKIRESVEEERKEVEEELKEAKEERREHRSEERFRTRVAILVSFLAMFLAIADVSGQEKLAEILTLNIRITDNWSFYQQKQIRQNVLSLAQDEFENVLLMSGDTLSPDARKNVEGKIATYKRRWDELESRPIPQPNFPHGDGRQEIYEQVREFEHERDHASAQFPNFHYSEGLFQIAIVLGSVAIVSRSRPVVGLALVLGALAVLLLSNGFFLFFTLPGGH